MGKQKKPKPGQAVVFKGAVATVVDVGDELDGHVPLVLDTHTGRVYNVWTDHPLLHIQ